MGKRGVCAFSLRAATRSECTGRNVVVTLIRRLFGVSILVSS